jgi:FkbM family methyltransferase
MNRLEQKKLSLEAELDCMLDEDILIVKEREQTAFDRLTAPFGKSLVLFGAGSLGRQALAELCRNGIVPLAFADNNPEKWDETLDGINILSPKNAAKKYGNQAAFIVTIRNHDSQQRYSDTKKELSNLECARIISFIPLLWKYPETFLPYYYMDLPSKIFLHAGEVKKAFQLLEDDLSRKTYISQLRWRIFEDYDSLPKRTAQSQYFPKGIFSNIGNEIFIDCGAFDGDTIKEILIHRGDAFSHIYSFEPDEINFTQLQHYLSTIPTKIADKITPFAKAVGAQTTMLNFFSTGSASSSIHINGNVEIEMVSIDDFLGNISPTFIKMDIEGGEVDALIGAKEVIQKEEPVLAICAYHHQSDLWDIPLMIHSISDQYHFFLRAHEDEGWELVYYAVPTNRLEI